jgi:ATP-dependent protease ClpP protease subunit
MENNLVRRSRNEEDDDEIEMIQIGASQSSMIRASRHTINNYRVYLDENIGEAKKYRDLIDALVSAGQHDEFNLFINNGGGYLYTALAIIEAIKASQATVRAIVVGECHSAASIITLSCHEIMITDAANMMVHSASFGSGGFAHNVKHHADFSVAQLGVLFDEVYGGFLTETEMKELKSGREFWFNAKEIAKRVANRMKHQQSKAKASIKKAGSTPKRTKKVVDEDSVSD